MTLPNVANEISVPTSDSSSADAIPQPFQEHFRGMTMIRYWPEAVASLIISIKRLVASFQYELFRTLQSHLGHWK